MFGAMIVKCISGADSLYKTVSLTIYDDFEELEKVIGFPPYYIAVILFVAISFLFSFGNIENSKMLQIVVTILRILTILLMLGTSVYSMIDNGVTDMS